MAPQLAADAPPPTTGVLTELSHLDLECTQITDAGCATLAAALDSGMLPALENAPPFEEAFEEDVSSDDGYPPSDGIPASVEAVAAVLEAMARQRRVARAQAQLGLPGPSYATDVGPASSHHMESWVTRRTRWAAGWACARLSGGTFWRRRAGCDSSVCRLRLRTVARVCVAYAARSPDHSQR